MSFLDDLFGGGDETQVGTSVSRVISDDMLPSAVKSGVIKSFFNDGDIPDYLMQELTGSMGIRAERMYDYASNHYTNGLPSGQTYSSTQGRQQVETTIETIEGQQVLMNYSHYGPANAMHIGWLKLASQYGYNQNTNEIANLSAVKGSPVYLQDMVVQVPSSMEATIGSKVIEQWGVAPDQGYTYSRPAGSKTLMFSLVGASSRVQYLSTVSAVQLLVTYEWMSNNAIQTGSLILTMSEYMNTGDYFQSCYTAGTTTKYWIYKNQSGTYPLLDSVFVDAPHVSGTYFPFTYLRHDATAINQDVTSEEYKTTKKMAKYIGMDIDTVANAIAENPNIGSVQQAIMMFSVPSVSTVPVECRYLFEYFDELFYSQNGTVSDPLAYLINTLFSNDVAQTNTIVIKDAKFRMALQNLGITKTMVAGSIGDIDTYTATYEGSDHKYRRQITTGLYEEITVQGLRMVYYVYGGYTTVGDGTNEILLIPIDRSITTNYSVPDRELLYARSLHIIFNSMVVTHVSWYQTGIFQVVMVIVAIVMTVIDFGTDGGSWIASALSLTGTAALVATVVFNLVVGQLIQIGARLFVKAVGADVAILVAVAAIVAGAYRVLADGMKVAKSFAETMLVLSSGLAKSVMQSKFSDLLDQKSAISAWIDEQTKLLDKANELLENNHLLEPFVIFGEKPEDFYNRTVHFGNIGTLGITAISSYVDLALTLPKINDTLGENDYGLSS